MLCVRISTAASRIGSPSSGRRAGSGIATPRRRWRPLEELLRRPPALRTLGLMLVGPYANGKTMIAERFAVEHLKTSERQRVWVVQTREGAGLAHFYASVLSAFRAPTGRGGDVGRKAEQIDHLLDTLKPRFLIFDEFHNALRGRPRDVEAVLAFLRRIGRQFDISPVLVGEVSVYDFINATRRNGDPVRLGRRAAMAFRRRIPHPARQPRRRAAAGCGPRNCRKKAWRARFSGCRKG